MLEALRLAPQYHPRVWGGQRLRPATPPIGEVWLVHEENRVLGGSQAGRTLGQIAAKHGGALLGSRAVARTGDRFPLLIKLLDTADWLSLQVHPDDAQAARLEGPGQFGKTEAWHILEAEPGARVICGVVEGTTPAALAASIRTGRLLDLACSLPVQAGDTIFMRAGTIHALGPGLLLYEVQQTSDITYRVFDWNRPAAAGRALHVEQSLAVADPTIVGRAEPCPLVGSGGSATLTACEYFALDLLCAEGGMLPLDTAGESFHALTVVEGAARVAGAGWAEELARYETLVVPAGAGAYEIQPTGRARLLKACVP